MLLLPRDNKLCSRLSHSPWIGLVLVRSVDKLALAAHSMTSFFGQGGCQAIEDAAELANRLRGTLQRSDMKLEEMSYDEISQMLSEYSQSRQKRVQDLASFSSNYARLHTADLPFGGFLRYMIYRFVPASGWMWYLRWLYGFQPSVDGLGERKETISSAA
jgi:2-polyprenyl-6-methoxyphenol hydroxylase-like FAD-dependent oxidoreductase